MVGERGQFGHKEDGGETGQHCHAAEGEPLPRRLVIERVLDQRWHANERLAAEQA